MTDSKRLLVWLTALITLGSGLINIFSVTNPALPERSKILRGIFPLEFLNLSRFAVLLMGFALVIASINIFKRKKRAYQFTITLAILSIGFHLGKGLDYEEAAFSLLLLIVLYLARNNFTVKSSEPNLKRGLLRFAVALSLAIAYGVAGFWFLEPKEFGINFHIGESIKQTFLFLSFIGNPELIPKTHYAKWFLDSLYFISATTIIYAIWALFRPVRYIFRILPGERERARKIAEEYGRHDLDFFKLWPDKSFFFRENAFLAYRVGANTAVVLGDPVGPEGEIEGIIREFKTLCNENDWAIIFHQTLPVFLPIYEKLGFERLKIGDDAIVDLTTFTTEGGEGKAHRHIINKMEKNGIHIEEYPPPVADDVLRRCKEVSDEWLKIGGHRERSFTLGSFDPKYLRETQIVAAFDETGKMQAFLNIVPSYHRGEATVDLMRRRGDSPTGIMDYLFIKVFRICREQGYHRFTLGMAPMSGFREGEEATQTEKAVHAFMQQLSFLFRFKGLFAFKAKYASYWEPRYVILEHITDLPRHAMAISAVSEL